MLKEREQGEKFTFTTGFSKKKKDVVGIEVVCKGECTGTMALEMPLLAGTFRSFPLNCRRANGIIISNQDLT